MQNTKFTFCEHALWVPNSFATSFLQISQARSSHLKLRENESQTVAGAFFCMSGQRSNTENEAFANASFDFQETACTIKPS